MNGLSLSTLMRRVAPVAGGTLTAAVLVAGCGSGDDAPANATKLSFELTDAGCVPSSAKAPAGPVEFEVVNSGTSKVTEFEVLEGDEILGERENLSDGLSGEFTLDLEQGEYVLYCPGGETEKGALTITGS
ncbi:MAG TPA: cupredoxin domain-containing protein [Solirubrobacterales bacterium]